MTVIVRGSSGGTIGESIYSIGNVDNKYYLKNGSEVYCSYIECVDENGSFSKESKDKYIINSDALYYIGHINTIVYKNKIINITTNINRPSDVYTDWRVDINRKYLSFVYKGNLYIGNGRDSGSSSAGYLHIREIDADIRANTKFSDSMLYESNLYGSPTSNFIKDDRIIYTYAENKNKIGLISFDPNEWTYTHKGVTAPVGDLFNFTQFNNKIYCFGNDRIYSFNYETSTFTIERNDDGLFYNLNSYSQCFEVYDNYVYYNNNGDKFLYRSEDFITWTKVMNIKITSSTSANVLSDKYKLYMIDTQSISQYYFKIYLLNDDFTYTLIYSKEYDKNNPYNNQYNTKGKEMVVFEGIFYNELTNSTYMQLLQPLSYIYLKKGWKLNGVEVETDGIQVLNQNDNIMIEY